MLGTGMVLIGALALGAGLMTFSSEKSLERLDSCDLSKRPYTKKILNVVGIEVLELTEEQRMGILEKLDYEIKEFVQGWVEGDSNVLEIPLFKLGLDAEAIGFKKELEALEGALMYLSVVEHGDVVESIGVCEDGFYLQLEIDKNTLKAFYEARLDEWREQGELERAEYWSSRGVI